ncbi:MAG: hypothetical protein SFX73_37015 [Kofleriaceae bacterium]|nr:hypothetical protein [Kofleriaceae bacterium]
MSRTSMRLLALLVISSSMLAGMGCEELDGRSRTRKGNRYFRDTKFVDAVAEYEKALTQVQSPIIHYNLALAYAKIFKPGVEKPVRLGHKGSFACSTIPNVKFEQATVCVKDGDRRFEDCDDKNVCASSYQCKPSELCVLDGAQLADAAATHFGEWVKANPDDDDTRKQMTQVWLDSNQYDRALQYWEGLLKDKPNDADVMGALAGINLKAGKWRESVEWYAKVAEVAKDAGSKVAAYQFIGNVAWSKLNSKTLSAAESFELADRGIGALQKAAALAPKNPKLWGLQASIYNFRALQHGASFAAAVDRASAQDLQRISRVLAEEAKKAQGGAPAPTTPTAPTPATPAPTAAGSATKAGG